MMKKLMKSNIILVGMPSCGKSTIGVVLAKTVNKNFLDTDILIQSTEEMTLQEIINNKGNEYFHCVEEEVLFSLKEKNLVIATGGGAVYFKEAIENLKNDGIVVYLRVNFETVLARLNNIKTRGVTLEEGQTLEDLYNYRIPMYDEIADITIDCDSLTVEEAIGEIINKISEKI